MKKCLAINNFTFNLKGFNMKKLVDIYINKIWWNSLSGGQWGEGWGGVRISRAQGDHQRVEPHERLPGYT